MSDNKIEIDLTHFLPTKVTRTLREGQVLCPICKGVGLIKRTEADGDFIVVCAKCYGRTYVTKCPHCGELDLKNLHSCDGARRERAIEAERKEQEKWDKAEKITYTEACKRYEQVVVDWDTYLPIEEVLGNIADGWIEKGERTIPRVWGTYTRSLSLDTSDILERELEDLHEDAEVRQRDKADLKAFLDEWCKRPSVVNSTMTYFLDERVAIVVTEDDVLSRYPDLRSGEFGEGE